MMEQLYLSLMLLCVSLTTLLFFILSYKHFTLPKCLPPGNIGLPVIGETLEFLRSGWKGHPERFIYERKAKYSSNVFKTSIIGEPTIVFCGAACNKFLFSNENKLVRSWLPTNTNKIFPSFQTNFMEEAKKSRHMLSAFIGPQALQRYVHIMDDVARTHFASDWENKTQVTVLPLAKRYTFLVACRLFINFDDPNQLAKMEEPFKKLVGGILTMPIDLPGTPFNQAIKASKFIRGLLMNIIKQRKMDLANGMATPTQDTLSHMLSSCDENGQYMTEHYIADKILGMFIGSHDTASSACTFTVKYLAELPQIYQNVYQEQMTIAKSKGEGELLNWQDIEKMKYSWNVAREVMRLVPPGPGAFREAIADFDFNGFLIPKGWKLYWSTYATHRDPECFKEPEKFDPSRFEGNGPDPYTFVPFGGGPRMCPGKEYARVEILVFMHNLVKRFKWEKVIPNEKTILDPLPFPAKGLPIRLYPHQT